MRQRDHDRLRQVALGLLGLLRGRAHRVVAEHREEHRGRAGRDAAEAERHVRREVVDLDVEGPDDDHGDHDRDLDEDQPGLDPRAGPDAPVQQPRHAEAQQHREEVDAVAGAGAGRAQHPGRQVDTEAAEEERDVLRDADGDHRDDRGVLQQQVPADEPADRPPRARRSRRCTPTPPAGSARRTRRTTAPRRRSRPPPAGTTATPPDRRRSWRPARPARRCRRR